MYKILIGISLLAITSVSYAIGVSCGDKMITYKLAEKSHFDLCPLENGDFNIYANAVGGNYHTCNFEGLATKKNDVYTAIDGDCEISFTLLDGTLSPSFGSACRSFCGARAGWYTGVYSK